MTMQTTVSTLRRTVRLRTRVNRLLHPPNRVIKAFHQLYYDDANLAGGTWRATYWLGTPVQKCPLDLWIYQEIIHELKPELIIEAGTFRGGSALFLASLLDFAGSGEVISIDIAARDALPAHPRITYLVGSSTSKEILAEVRRRAQGKPRIMVILDSDHTKTHVLRELELYSDLVSVGSYLIVEDTNINGHPVGVESGPGPMEAIEDFLEVDRRFAIDRSREKLLLTFNPRGYLRRIAP